MFFGLSDQEVSINKLKAELAIVQTELAAKKAELATEKTNIIELAEKKEFDKAGLIDQGRLMERDRLEKICKLPEFHGREEVALRMAFQNPDLKPDAFSTLLQNIPKAKHADQFSEYMAKLGNPDLDPDWDPDDEQENTDILQSIAQGKI